MALQCGLVGLPNVGKSTLFNALTKSSQAESANYPFCTIDPNVGRIEVPDERFDLLVDLIKPEKMVAATINFVDIAGLVKGASQGEGLGNKFLSHIHFVDAILHIVRCFNDENITHVAGDVNPKQDVEIIELELILSDLDKCTKRLENLKKKVRSGDEVAIRQEEVVCKIKEVLEKNKAVSSLELSKEEQEIITDIPLLTQKPVIFIGNIDEDHIHAPNENSYFQELSNLAKSRNSLVLPISGKIESELSLLDEVDKQDFLQDLGILESGLNRVIRETYKMLGYISFFTAGKEEVRAWEIFQNTPAPKAAGKIHSDIEHGFIRAEVTSFSDFQKYGNFKKAQETGKTRIEGKDYIVQDGDIMYFRFNV